MSVSTFLTINGLLLAVLTVWAQYWQTTYQIYQKNNVELWTIGYGLIGIYGGVLLTLLAIATASIGSWTGKKWPLRACVRRRVKSVSAF
jgi:hypothetical protein